MASKSPLRFDSLQDPTTRYNLRHCIGNGVFSNVYLAKDQKASDKKVAIKIQKYTKEYSQFIQEEYRILRDYSDHPNLPDFYGVYKKKCQSADEIWFVMEYCEGGPVTDLTLGLLEQNRRMSEEHIAYILREVIKAAIFLHEKNIIHRDIRGNNILLTNNGEVKLIDFGLCRELDGPLGKRSTCIGSPYWMAPEVVTSEYSSNEGSINQYGSRADVWSVGITAIELADGKAPFQDAHPTRALFQIVHNPPPGLLRPSNWSVIYNDFISECLEKNPELRPFMIEIQEHPFFENLPENDYYLTQELRQLRIDFATSDKIQKKPECLIHKRLLKKGPDMEPESMFVEDLAALEKLNEESILSQLRERMNIGQFYTFVGDVLLVLNPNERQDIYSQEYHAKYSFKSRSDNAPHIYAVADSAFQAALHHEEPQHILLSGESLSGKTTSCIHLIEHLAYLGQSPNNKCGEQVLKALSIIHALSNASTPLNSNSTRCILQTQMTFGSTGKISGAIFFLFQLEKWRVSSTDMSQANFHILYYFYDAMEAENQLSEYHLEPGRPYRYFRVPESKLKSSSRPRDNPKSNFKQFLIFQQNLIDLGIEESQIETVWTVLAAILHLGDVQFNDTVNKIAEIDNVEQAKIVAKLLKVDEKKFLWSLINYCSIHEGTATKRKHTSDEARDARDILANTLYSRLVDWIVNLINAKLSIGRAVFGDKYTINILDSFGFECYEDNRLEQLYVNIFNEQMQYHYSQRVFAWEMLEQQEEHVPAPSLTYYDNRSTIDELMGRPNGLLNMIDEASKSGLSGLTVINALKNSSKTPHIKVINQRQFAVAHYTGTVQYNAKGMAENSRDFLPPEVISVFRLSTQLDVRKFFSNTLNKTGNLTLDEDKSAMTTTTRKARWSAAVVKEAQKIRKVSFEGFGGLEFSQTRKMRTANSIFRSTSLEVLKTLSIGAGSGGTHFVRCIRADLCGTARGFQTALVQQQLKALAVLDTAKARQRGYPHRISFNEFIRRYKFLAFDFDENVDVTKENCRLLLIRLKMEGWIIGRSKVFLKYYNEEYLARLYEIHVKKIIKVQCMMRSFLARRKTAHKLKESKDGKQKETSRDDAALIIQKAYRGYAVRKNYGPLIHKATGKLNEETAEFIRPYACKWRKKSMFQVILHYRAAKFQDIVNLSQQVHIFNQNVVLSLQSTINSVPLEKINPKAAISEFLQDKKPTVWKLPFKFDQVPYFDTSYMCDPYTSGGPIIAGDDDQEPWDTPLRWRNTIASQVAQSLNVQEPTKPTQAHQKSSYHPLINIPFCRDPNVPVNQIRESPAIRHTTYTPLKPIMERPSSYDYEFDSAPTKFVMNKNPGTTINPIKELELIGRKNIENEDDPPFNFQGMLRKTNYNRDSMKRMRREEDDSPPSIPSQRMLRSTANSSTDDYRIHISEYRSKTPPTQIDNNYDEDEFEEPNRNSVNTVVYQSKVKKNINNVYNGNIIPSEILDETELIPGVIVEGVVVDL